jgi:P27 family predicted phage terminase small subunit
MAGRKPKPSALHELEGTRNRRKTNEPKPTGVPICPKHLDKTAKQEWKRISAELLSLGLLTSVDRAALAAYCTAWSRWCDAEANIQKDGPVCVSPKSGYPMQSPWVGIANTSMQMMHRFLSEFGMTPASRSRISVANADDSGEDAFETFMKGIGAVDITDGDSRTTNHNEENIRGTGT